MPIRGRWRRFNLTIIKSLPEDEGAYELANSAKSIIYNGSSTNVRRRLMTHHNSGNFPTARYFRCELCSFLDIESGIDKEAHHAERIRAKTGRKPKYSKRSPHPFRLFDI